VSIVPVEGVSGIVYKETLETYSRIDGETFRTEKSREFILDDYSFIELNDNGTITPAVEMEILYDTQRGQVESIIEPLKAANFELTPTFLENGSVSDYSWDMFLFRDVNHPSVNGDPFDDEIRTNFTRIDGHRRFDLVSDEKFVSVNLEYYEYQMINSKMKRLRVNTELSSNNELDGRVIKSAIHIIKRDGKTVIFDYNWNIQEVSTVYRYYNLLDQPFLLVPYQLGAVVFIIFLYSRILRYWKVNNYKIIREELPKEDEVSEN